MGKRFEELHPGVRVDVQTGGSSRGVNDTRQGLNDIGMVSRPLKGDESDLHGFAIARDGVSIIRIVRSFKSNHARRTMRPAGEQGPPA